MLRFPRALSGLPPPEPEKAFGFGAGLVVGVAGYPRSSRVLGCVVGRVVGRVVGLPG